jgi:very-short-patch-repair endonuclease
MESEKELIFLECEICNKQWVRIPNKKNKYSKTCSDECFKKLMSKIRSKNRIQKTCLICNNTFFTSKVKNRSTCSKKCGYDLKKSKTKYVIIECKVCKKIKKVAEKRYEYYQLTKPGSFVFCSTKCSLKNSKNTFIETAIKNILLLNNINFEMHYTLNRFHFDFYIPYKNILIECQGDYWHGNNDVFKEFSEKQIKTQEKDNRKKLTAAQQNYKILYFWETEIVKNINYVKSIIQKECVDNLNTMCPICKHKYYSFEKNLYTCNACNHMWRIES